jgi:hypothetical protein
MSSQDQADVECETFKVVVKCSGEGHSGGGEAGGQKRLVVTQVFTMSMSGSPARWMEMAFQPGEGEYAVYSLKFGGVSGMYWTIAKRDSPFLSSPPPSTISGSMTAEFAAKTDQDYVPVYGGDERPKIFFGFTGGSSTYSAVVTKFEELVV